MKLLYVFLFLVGSIGCQTEPLIPRIEGITVSIKDQPTHVIATAIDSAMIYGDSFRFVVEEQGTVEVFTSEYPNICEFYHDLYRIGIVDDVRYDVRNYVAQYFGEILEKEESRF